MLERERERERERREENDTSQHRHKSLGPYRALTVRVLGTTVPYTRTSLSDCRLSLALLASRSVRVGIIWARTQ